MPFISPYPIDTAKMASTAQGARSPLSKRHSCLMIRFISGFLLHLEIRGRPRREEGRRYEPTEQYDYREPIVRKDPADVTHLVDKVRNLTPEVGPGHIDSVPTRSILN